MGWLILILGVGLWWAAHLFKRIAPARRAQMGDAGKGKVAAALGVSVVLMVIGFRMTPYVGVWTPPSWTIHVNNTLVLIGIFMMTPAAKRGAILYKMRHPMLTGFGLWALAHLLVNGDLASIIMFGGLLAWAVVTKKVINTAEPDWTPGEKGSLAKDAMFFVASIVLLGVIATIHTWLGYWPFPA